MKIEVNSSGVKPLSPNFVSGKVYKKINGSDYYICTSSVNRGEISSRLVNLATGVCWSNAPVADPSNGDAHKFALVENIKVVVG